MAEFSSITTISRELQGLTLIGVTRVDNQPLGKGSYGEVFAVKHGRETYAAKQIHQILVEAVSPEEKRIVRDNFVKECHRCKNLNHPNVVRFIGVYYPDPHSILPVMVMELMDTSLTDYVKTPNISMKLKISILHDVAQGLKFLHCRIPPIIHRDLSPNNILLSRDSVAKISDLGVAKVVKAGNKNPQSKLTKAPGTTDFMPPEALSDNPAYSTGLDIFSYGGVILHVVNQEWPAPTSLVEYDSKMKPVKTFTEVERRQRYLDVMTGEAGKLKSLVVRCLDNDPAKRPAAANVLEELKELKVQQEYKVINKNMKSSDNSIPLGTDIIMVPDTSQYAILLDTTIGYIYKEPSWLKNAKDWVFGKQKQYSKKNVISGALLEELSEEEILLLPQQFDLTLNYKVLYSEHTIWLYCEPKQIKQLSYKEMKSLQAVKSFNDRLEGLSKLDWIGSLTPGSDCFLSIPTAFDRPVKVIIRYVGSLPSPDRCGTYFGVELLECRGRGNTDGSFQEYRMFTCSPNCGVFVSMDKLILIENEAQPVTHQPRRQESVTDDRPFQKNDRVEAFDVKAVSEKGTVKWIGRNEKVLANGVYIVGIYTDRVLHDLEDRFPYQIKTMNHLIEDSREHSRLFLPAYVVKKDQGGDGGTVSHGYKHDTRFPQQNRSLTNYRYDQQLHNNHQIAQQNLHAQGICSRGTFHPDVGQQGMYSSPQLQNMSSQYSPQGVPYHGMPQQDMQLQGMSQQGISQQGMSQPGMPPQGTNMAHGHPYQQGMSQNYQTEHYNQPSNKGNWHGENPGPLYPVERQQLVPFHQILRAVTVPNNTSSSGYQEAPHNMPPLEKDDAIQCGNNPVRYGTIKWIGTLPGSKELTAGVEMEQPVEAGATNGWHDGCQYFVCEPGKGMFLRIRALRRDDRFTDVKGPGVPNPLGKFDLYSSIKLKTFILQPSETLIKHVHTGRGKGIQGHQNSCYIDSTLYGLFAFSGAFDDLFLEEVTDQIGMIIKSTLQSILNTLRHNNVVLYDHIMILRDELDKLQHIKGLKSNEKNPEEFLNLLFKHVLNVEAFLRIKRPFSTDEEFFVQLFVEGNKHHIPNTQDLLTEMFNDQQITFAKYPLRLLLQIPRCNQFKTFKGVIPSLELDVTTLCEQYVGKCMVCSKQGTDFCPDCGPGKQGGIKENPSYFCKDCVGLWHTHENRKHHKPISKQSSSDGVDGGDTGRLRLLSVLCIETSHYVCFTRVQGSGTNEWVFFDSMAERPDDVHNIPHVTQCTQQLNEWVYGNKDLTNYTSKELPELVRRFVEDGYLCIYVDQDGIMYS